MKEVNIVNLKFSSSRFFLFSNRHDEPSEIEHVALVFENELGVYKISKVSFIGNEDLKFIYERYNACSVFVLTVKNSFYDVTDL